MKSVEYRILVTSALETDPGLATAPFKTQFYKLVRDPIQLMAQQQNNPMVVIIDALDECEDTSFEELAHILREGVPQLPSSIKFFVTSRQSNLINRHFSSASTIDLGGDSNVRDCKIYVRSQLETLGKAHSHSASSMDSDIIACAGGLFVWIRIFFGYLKEKREDPLATLKAFHKLPAEQTMAPLYTYILDRFDWGDDDFVHDYRITLGAIIASQRPLSATAWEVILSPFLKFKSSVRSTLEMLSLFLTGIHEAHAPIRILHHSFRDFILDGANGINVTQRWSLVEMEMDHERMALRCFQIMDVELSNVDDLRRAGDLEQKIPLRSIPSDHLSEQLQYACQFVEYHASLVHSPKKDIEESVQTFLDQHIIDWMELSVRTGRYINIQSFPEWVKVRIIAISCRRRF